MDQAAANGHIAVVKWLHYNCIEGCSREAITKAIVNNHLEVVVFLNGNRTKGFDIEAIRSDNPSLELTQWELVYYREEMNGWMLTVPSWDWYFNDWCQSVNLQKRVGGWECDSERLHIQQ
ncbi:unnamed protein product [Phytophthora lilii]|uniref:Unnamed protein product n=1 Tax=Phytophthora lilii TaxID=2077276 RepID=A0A9W7D7V9_9STRA|nr:unnamed protein product [Phytophthora lilii]